MSLKLYKMKKTAKNETFLGTLNKDSVYWALEPEEDATIVSSEDECKYYDVQYAIEYDINHDFTVEELLKIMYEELSVDEAKQLCGSDEKIEQIFLAYISGKTTSEKLEEAKNAANNASVLATLSMLKN